MSRIFLNPTTVALPTASTLLALAASMGGLLSGAAAVAQQQPAVGLADAAERQEADDTSTEISRLIEQLVSERFADRVAARQELVKQGEAALDPVRAALQSAGREKRIRLQNVLTELESKTFRGRLEALQRRPSPATAARLPQWDRFQTLCGSSPEAVDYFIRLVQAESDLFRLSEGSPRDMRMPLQVRATQLEELHRQKKLPMDAFVAVLFLAGNNDIVLRTDTSTNVTACLAGDFERSLRGADQTFLRKLAGQWILRRNISVIRPLQFSRQHQLPEGLELARRTLRGRVRRGEGIPAMMLLKEQGSEADIAVLESLFDTQRADYNALAADQRLFTDEASKYVCQLSDVALSLAIAMRGGHPWNFGFREDPGNAPPARFAFTLGSAGFTSEEDRAAAREAYRVAYDGEAGDLQTNDREDRDR